MNKLPHFANIRDGGNLPRESRAERILGYLLAAAYIAFLCAVTAWAAHQVWTAFVTGAS